MPILNYTTTIESEKSIMEIEKILIAHGAQSIFKDYYAGLPIALSFIIKNTNGSMPVRLPADPEAVLKVMYVQKLPGRFLNKAQAYRVAWRIIKDWVEAQMAILETNQVKLEQIFLPYIETQEGKTIFQIFEEKKGLFLTAGNKKEGE